MDFKIENLEVSMKGVVKTIVLVGVGVGIGRLTRKKKERTVFVVLEDRTTAHKTSNTKRKVESK